jgi:FlaA1/EpsC-like NDP-sugar epimerase
MGKYMFPKNNTPRWVIIAIDLIISALSLTLAYLIRFDIMADKAIWKTELGILFKFIWVFFFVRIVVFYLFGIHKGIVRHTSTVDFRRLFLAIFSTSFLFLILGYIRYYFIDEYYLFPLSVLIIEFVFCVFISVFARVAIKLIYLKSTKTKGYHPNVLIYGAGVYGLIVKRTIEKDTRIPVNIVGFIDDDKKKIGTRIEGVEVFATQQIVEFIAANSIDQVIFTIQQPDEENQQRVVNYCLDGGIQMKKVPSPSAWLNGEFSAKQIAQVNIDDLLGRKPIVLNLDKLQAALANQVILVTGAAGSIGAGLVHQLLQFSPATLILLDQAESPMYELEITIKKLFPKQHIEIVIGDIRNRERMHAIFATYTPAWVFHAAAYKHVPLMEDNPSEAIQTNVFGTKNLVDLAVAFKVEKFVMISTDKAVNPTNVMGATKRVAEMIAQAANTQQITQFITTRFGNVLGSNGSVIPLFRKQIEEGGPVTVTDERITRFFMTIPEACQLVLEAGVIGNGGEIFVFDMGKSVKIVDLAKNMIRLSGLELGKDIEIQFTGLRPGEKLYEELLNKAEDTIPTHHPKILKALERTNNEQVLTTIQVLQNELIKADAMTLVGLLKKIVPEFISNNSEYSILDNNQQQ